MPDPTSERIGPGAEQARRDDLARDVARLWLAVKLDPRRRLPDYMGAALDRLADAYDFNAAER